MSDACETVLEVTGMTCMSCTRHVDGALRDVEGVKAVEVKLREGKARVQHGSDVSLRELIDAIEGAGYGVRRAS